MSTDLSGIVAYFVKYQKESSPDSTMGALAPSAVRTFSDLAGIMLALESSSTRGALEKLSTRLNTAFSAILDTKKGISRQLRFFTQLAEMTVAALRLIVESSKWQQNKHILACLREATLTYLLLEWSAESGCLYACHVPTNVLRFKVVSRITIQVPTDLRNDSAHVGENGFEVFMDNLLTPRPIASVVASLLIIM
jgi:hypothetical protein